MISRRIDPVDEKEKKVPAKKMELKREEINRGMDYFKRKKQRGEPPALKVIEQDGDQRIQADTKGDPDTYLPVWLEACHRATGTVDGNFGLILISQVVKSITKIDPENEPIINAISAVMAEIGPKDPIEGMLVAQMLALHSQGMASMKLSLSSQYLDYGERYAELASKLFKAFSVLVETLKKYRTGGMQKVVVEHVNVDQGGKAIVGIINREGG